MVQSDLSNPRNCWNFIKKIYEADMLLQKALDDAMIEILTEEKGP